MSRATLKLLFLVVVVFCSTQLFSQEKHTKIKWYTFEEAMELNKENPRKVFVDVYTDWCGWCTRMDNSTFSNPVIAEYMNENYYPVKLNAETHDTIMYKDVKYYSAQSGRRPAHQLAIALLQGQMSYPSYAFLDEESNLITVAKGYVEAKDFEPMIHYIAQDKYKNTQFPVFKSTFEGRIE